MGARYPEGSITEALETLEWRVLARARVANTLRTREWWVSASAALFALALHAMLFAPLAFGMGSRVKRMPDEQGLGSNAIVASAEMVPTLTLISLSPSISRLENALLELASRGITPPRVSLIVASPNADLAFDEDVYESKEEETAAVDEFSASGADRAMLFGRYMGQVVARVERAWRRPRVALTSGYFECQTRIEQDASGKVLSIELLSCNGDARWQQSLVMAIERASPLSAPPEPSVFSSTLFLNFRSKQYEKGVSAEEEYEPELEPVDAHQAQFGQPTPLPERLPMDLRDYKGSIELTIVGKNATWALQDTKEPAVSTPQAGVN